MSESERSSAPADLADLAATTGSPSSSSRSSPGAITVRLDDRPIAVADGTTLAQLLAQDGRAQDAVATALNGRFVARAARESTPLRDGDQVLFFQPIVGG